MATIREDNSALYFIVGGLVVLALVFGLIYMGGEIPTAAPDRIIERTSETKIVPGTTENTTTNYNFGPDQNTANPETPPQ